MEIKETGDPLLPVEKFFSEEEISKHRTMFAILCRQLAAESIPMKDAEFPHPFSYAVGKIFKDVRAEEELVRKASQPAKSTAVYKEEIVEAVVDVEPEDDCPVWEKVDSDSFHVHVLDEEGIYRAYIFADGTVDFQEYGISVRKRASDGFEPGDQHLCITDIKELRDVLNEIIVMAQQYFPDKF